MSPPLPSTIALWNFSPPTAWPLSRNTRWRKVTPVKSALPIENALVSFNKILTKYPDSLYAKDATEKIKALRNQQAEYQFRIGYFYYKKEAYPAAIARLDALLKTGFPPGEITEKTLYYMGLSHYRNGNKEMAALAFQRLKSEYAASPYIQELPF